MRWPPCQVKSSGQVQDCTKLRRWSCNRELSPTDLHALSDFTNMAPWYCFLAPRLPPVRQTASVLFGRQLLPRSPTTSHPLARRCLSKAGGRSWGGEGSLQEVPTNMICPLSPCYLDTFTHTWKTREEGVGGSRPTFNDERVLPACNCSCSVTTYSLLSPLAATTTTLPGCDWVEALPHHPPLLILASGLQVVAVRCLEVGWQPNLRLSLVDAVSKLRIGVHRLLLATVRLVGEVVGWWEIWL